MGEVIYDLFKFYNSFYFTLQNYIERILIYKSMA